MLGRPKAPVTLVEYADLQCPYCAEWTHRAFPALVVSLSSLGLEGIQPAIEAMLAS